ncbi:MAG: hypothetical protein ACREEM_22515, partial [Blastocatellia bacterium]
IVDDAVRTHDQSRPAGKVETINAILPYLKLVRDRIERAEQIERIADRLKIESNLIRSEVRKAANIGAERVSERAVTASLAVKPAEKKLLEALLNSAALRRQLMFQITEEDYQGLRTAGLFQLIFEFERQQIEPTYSALAERLEDEDLARSLLPELMIGRPTSGKADQDSPERPERFEWEAIESLKTLRCDKLAEKQAVLKVEINQAQRANEPTDAEIMRKLELAKQERRQWLEGKADSGTN